MWVYIITISNKETCFLLKAHAPTKIGEVLCVTLMLLAYMYLYNILAKYYSKVHTTYNAIAAT
jgi:hypothetical protein